jgi:3-mercaptopyruvate sulfurtransferase SseA
MRLKDRLDEIPRDRPVIPVCHAGMRSGQATVILRQAGFPRVANLRGGMLSWQQLGLPVVRGATRRLARAFPDANLDLQEGHRRPARYNP